MNPEYPNYQLIEYMTKETVVKYFVEQKIPDFADGSTIWSFRMQTFPQVWPNTAGAFGKSGMLSGAMMTDQYTTIAESRISKIGKTPEEWKEWVGYAVFFGNEFGYLITEPKDIFFEDIKEHRMAAVDLAEGRY